MLTGSAPPCRIAPDLSDAGIKDHVLWGALLLVTLVYGPGKFALDRWFERRQPA